MAVESPTRSCAGGACRSGSNRAGRPFPGNLPRILIDNVRVVAFEEALSKLDPAHQKVLILTYRDGLRHADAAAMLGCSTRTICYLLPAARRRLADTLNRLYLL